jgi:hypothetical protein
MGSSTTIDSIHKSETAGLEPIILEIYGYRSKIFDNTSLICNVQPLAFEIVAYDNQTNFTKF